MLLYSNKDHFQNNTIHREVTRGSEKRAELDLDMHRLVCLSLTKDRCLHDLIASHYDYSYSSSTSHYHDTCTCQHCDPAEKAKFRDVDISSEVKKVCREFNEVSHVSASFGKVRDEVHGCFKDKFATAQDWLKKLTRDEVFRELMYVLRYFDIIRWRGNIEASKTFTCNPKALAQFLTNENDKIFARIPRLDGGRMVDVELRNSPRLSCLASEIPKNGCFGPEKEHSDIFVGNSGGDDFHAANKKVKENNTANGVRNSQSTACGRAKEGAQTLASKAPADFYHSPHRATLQMEKFLQDRAQKQQQLSDMMPYMESMHNKIVDLYISSGSKRGRAREEIALKALKGSIRYSGDLEDCVCKLGKPEAHNSRILREVAPHYWRIFHLRVPASMQTGIYELLAHFQVVCMSPDL